MASACVTFTVSAFVVVVVAGVMHITESMSIPYDPEMSRPSFVPRRIPGHSGHPHPYHYVNRSNGISRTIYLAIAVAIVLADPPIASRMSSLQCA
jgi:hypothetical protein